MSSSGSVKKWLPKGFGFIEQEDGSDIFVHVSACDGREFLNIGEKVTYDIGQDERSGRDRAINVTGDGSGEEPDMEERRGGFGGSRQGGRNDDRRGGSGGYRNDDRSGGSYGRDNGGYGGRNDGGY